MMWRTLMYEHAEMEYPNECCGVLLGNKDTSDICEIVPADNTDEYDIRNIHFAMDPLAIYKVERMASERGLVIIGFYHSHVDHPAIPSSEDERYMIPGLLYMIVSVEQGHCADVRAYSKECEKYTGMQSM